MKAALYARVSTIDKDQNPEIQLEKLRGYCNEQGWETYKEYIDKASAADLTNRKEWTALMKAAAGHQFKVLLVWRIDRAFRSVIHAANTLEMLRGYNVGFHSFMEPVIDTTTAMGEFVFNILVAVSQLERQTISQRVQAGVDHAKAHGTRSGNAIGRPRKDIDFTNVCKAVRDSKGNYTRAAEILFGKTGIRVTPGFVSLRISRSKLTKDEILAGAVFSQ